MRPRPLPILLLLLAGAVVNVGVGWACAWWVPLGSDGVVEYNSGGQWIATPHDRVGVTWVASYTPVKLAAVDILPGWPEEYGEIGINRWIFASGWPLRALEGVLWTNADRKRTVTAEAILEVTGRGGAPARLPLRPLWPGFLVDSIAGGAALWLLVHTPLGVRRLGRRRRNRCPGCGYPVGSSPVYTECGASISS